MSKFVSEKRAPGICDRCGLKWKLKKLKGEFVRGAPRNNRVCPICYDPDHPLNWEGSMNFTEASGLRNPRPDSAELQAVRSMPAWNPVGNPATTMRAKVGTVRVGV